MGAASGAMDFARRHKKKLIALGLVGGAGYYAYRTYVAPILEDPIMAEVMKSMTGAGADPQKVDAEQQQHLEESERGTFELSVKSSTGDLKALQSLVQNAVYGDQIEFFNQKAFQKKVAEGPAEQIRMFEQLKIWAFTLAVSAAYVVALQTVHRRMQLYIIAAHKARHTIERNNSGDGELGQMMTQLLGADAEGAAAPTASTAIPVQELGDFLQSSSMTSGFLATEGLSSLVDDVRAAVTKQFGSQELKSVWNADSLKQQLEAVRAQVETAGMASLFRQYFIGAEAEDGKQLNLQLCDLIEFEAFEEMLQAQMDWAFGMFHQLYKSQISKALAKAKEQKAAGEVKKEANEGSLHLAKVLAVFKKLPAQLFKEEWVRTLNQPEEVKDFFFQVFTSCDNA